MGVLELGFKGGRKGGRGKQIVICLEVLTMLQDQNEDKERIISNTSYSQ